MNRFLKILLVAVAVAAATAAAARPAEAQLNGENLLGDMGVKSGSQPAPGFYAGYLFYRYHTDTVRDSRGNELTFDPGGNQSINASVPLVVYVSKVKLFGGNLGMMGVLPIANGSLEAPSLGLYEDASTGLSDAYIMPFQLGWHRRRADITTGFAVFMPNGRYEAEASDNLGKGMWSYELSAGTTVYADQARSISVAAMAYWETHTRKAGTQKALAGPITLSGVRPGQLLTIEGGAAKSFLHGAAHLGMAYYGQWKLTADDLGGQAYTPDGVRLAKHRVYGIGPDLSFPIATRTRLISVVNVRYLIETGSRMKTEGSSLMVTTTMPLPLVTLGAGK
ncbi:MAG TPA: transporter [Vicinamibacterales bacterium]|nr:transporter [Vicinamibacterales bacterium]